jgi:hypothetical protein
VAVGDERIVQAMLKRLQENEWGNMPAKILVRGHDGMPSVPTLGFKPT